MWEIANKSCYKDLNHLAENLDLEKNNSKWSLSLMKMAQNELIYKINNEKDCDKKNLLKSQLEELKNLNKYYKRFLNEKLSWEQNGRINELFKRVLEEIKNDYSIKDESNEIKKLLDIDIKNIDIYKEIETEKAKDNIEDRDRYIKKVITLWEKNNIDIKKEWDAIFMINEKWKKISIPGSYSSKQLEIIFKAIKKIKEEFKQGSKLYTSPDGFISRFSRYIRWGEPYSINDIYVDEPWKPWLIETTPVIVHEDMEEFFNQKRWSTHIISDKIVNFINSYLE